MKIVYSHLLNFLEKKPSLEELSKKAKLYSKWEFLVSVQPLKIDKGTGSPVNAIAVF